MQYYIQTEIVLKSNDSNTYWLLKDAESTKILGVVYPQCEAIPDSGMWTPQQLTNIIKRKAIMVLYF